MGRCKVVVKDPHFIKKHLAADAHILDRGTAGHPMWDVEFLPFGSPVSLVKLAMANHYRTP